MISLIQIEEISRKLKTNTTVIAREYLQLVFLQNFYELPGSEKIFFKGGTAIRFLMEGFRFSEDLDFTCEASLNDVKSLVAKTVEKMQNAIAGLGIKEKKSLVGKTYLLTMEKGLVPFPVFMRLDFSFREKVLQKEKHIIKTGFPIIFTSFIHHLGPEEILAEKTRAIMSRKAGRDLFDFWFLLQQGHKINKNYIKSKMDYYPKIDFSWENFLRKIEKYDFDKFKKDILPFISIDKRAKIDEMFSIIQNQTEEKIVSEIRDRDRDRDRDRE